MATEQQSVDLVDGDVVRSFARAALLAVLIGASAPVAIPIGPAPITLQVLFVFLAGLVLGPLWGSFSMVLYLTAGAVGVPVFAGMESGFGVLVGETAGYLWSYPIAAGLIGLFVHRGTELRDPAEQSLAVVVVALLAGLIVIYGMGVGHMMWLLHLDLWEALLTGMVFFLPGDFLKLVAAILIVKSGQLAVGTHESR
ncbi:biotin transporter BioY [Natronolimnobius sp. AArcel1]|uniref:biotin transporter BioY n=1 Tax=Natronolimnobius sp. AArcel1 TaxID=1679093 RepID=UPI0013EB085C|nr:biotin transporter BioY [Natronolimnobius sp. AArcel1]NGM67716.1 biotin transporter BioY [Natronolimnobius sp. AArcel1]